MVRVAERCATKVKDAAFVFADDEKLMALSTHELCEAADRIAQAETLANEVLGDAKQILTSRQLAAKAIDESSKLQADFMKLQSRLSAAQADIFKSKKYSASKSSIQQRIAIRRCIEEADNKLKGADQKVAHVAAMAEKVSESGSVEGEF